VNTKQYTHITSSRQEIYSRNRFEARHLNVGKEGVPRTDDMTKNDQKCRTSLQY